MNSEAELRKKKLQEWEKKYNNPFQITKFSRNIDLQTIIQNFSAYSQDELKEKSVLVSVAGRLSRLDPHGKKLIFADLTNQTEKIQLKVSENKENQDQIKDFAELLNEGDIVGVKGIICRTNRGELSIEVNDFVLLSKCLNPVPNNLINTEERLRKRHLDLLVNPENRQILVKRHGIIKAIRKFLDDKEYVEIETPILVSSASGALAKPFTTYHNKLRRDFYLRIATEIPLKMLLVGGFEKIYEIGRIFRNEGIDARHNPEFTTIEVYQAYENAEYMMNFVEELLHYLAKEILKKEKFEFTFKLKNKEISYVINFQVPFRKISMLEAIKEYENIDFTDITEKEKILELIKNYHLEIKPHQNTAGHIILAFFEKYVEKKLIQPIFIYDYPIETSPLAKNKENEPLWAERFELFVNGLELANGYNELNDPKEQEKRFAEQTKQKELGNEEIATSDQEFIEALEYGMPPAAGLGIGIDRLVMLFMEQDSIKEVIAFPQLKEKKN